MAPKEWTPSREEHDAYCEQITALLTLSLVCGSLLYSVLAWPPESSLFTHLNSTFRHITQIVILFSTLALVRPLTLALPSLAVNLFFLLVTFFTVSLGLRLTFNLRETAVRYLLTQVGWQELTEVFEATDCVVWAFVCFNLIGVTLLAIRVGVEQNIDGEDVDFSVVIKQTMSR